MEFPEPVLNGGTFAAYQRGQFLKRMPSAGGLQGETHLFQHSRIFGTVQKTARFGLLRTRLAPAVSVCVPSAQPLTL